MTQTNMFDGLDQTHFLDGIPTSPATVCEPVHMGHCLGCGGVIGAHSAKEWSRKVRQPCPHCGKKRW